VVIVTVVVWDVKSARGVIWLVEKLILSGIPIVCVLIVMVVVWDAKWARGEIW